jgi:hypothetical protein
MLPLKNIVLFVVTILALLLYIEIYLRWSGVSNPSYVYDNDIVGRTHNKDYNIIITGAEGFCIDKVNKYGYVGPDYPKERNTSAIRIALLGSSYIEGLQVFRRNRFSTIFEQELTKKLNHPVEVLNFGIGGDDFRGMYTRYQKLVKAYNPDYVLFIIQGESLLRRKTIPSPDLMIENDSLVFNYDFLKSSESGVRHRFRLLREFGLGNLVKEAFEVYYTGRLPKIVLDNFYIEPEKNNVKKNNNDSTKFYELNSKIVESLFKENKNSRFTNLIIEMEEIPTIYSTLLDSINFPRILLYQDLKQYKPEDLNFWRASGIMGHWNNFAHRVVGETLADEISTFISTDSGHFKTAKKD